MLNAQLCPKHEAWRFPDEPERLKRAQSQAVELGQQSSDPSSLTAWAISTSAEGGRHGSRGRCHQEEETCGDALTQRQHTQALFLCV